MEQSVFSNRGGRLRGRVKKFFKETFRAHGRSDYSEALFRGTGARKEGVSPYPWLYIRVLAAFIVFFAAAVALLYVTDNVLGYPHIVLFGGLMGNIPFLLLLYELYPRRDLSFFTLLAVAVLGGFCSVALAQLGYALFDPAVNKWADAVWIGFWEEFTKALFAVIFIVILKKRDPMAAFLIGAAVAAGFSVSEDMGYIYYYSRAFISSVYIDEAVYIGVERSVMSICTHMPWTGVICWAYAHFKSPFVNFRFYLGCLVSMTLHACWDLPVKGWVEVVDIALCTCAAVALQIAIITDARRQVNVVRQTAAEGEEIAPSAAERYSHRANLALAVCAVAASLLTLLCVYFHPQTFYYTKNFTDPAEFAAFMQNGVEMNVDAEREYDYEAEDYAYYVSEGVKIQALQCVEDGELTYIYVYNFLVKVPDGDDTYVTDDDVCDGEALDGDGQTADGDAENGEASDESATAERVPVLSNIYVRLDGTEYYVRSVLAADGTKIYFCLFNTDVRYFSLSDDFISVTLDGTYETGVWENIIFGYAALAVTVGGAAAFVTLKIKARRKNYA